jgi:NitT/TauT family transport system substrate-binding protein
MTRITGLRWRLVVPIVAAGLVLSSCGSGDSATTSNDNVGQQKEDAPTLVLGIPPTVDSAPAMLAIDKGYFADLGIDVKLDTNAQPSNKALPPLATGDYTVVAMPIGAAIFNAIDRGSLVNLLSNYGQDSEDGKSLAGVLVSKKLWDAGVQTSAGLKGKKIAVVAPGGWAEFNTYQALAEGGLTEKDVKFTTMTFADLGPALANGSVDAGWCPEPLCTQFVEKGLAERLPVNANNGEGIYQLFVNADYSKKYPQTVTKMLAGWVRAATDLNNGGWQDDANLQIISKYTKIPTEVLKTVPALKGHILTTTKDEMTPSFELINTMQEYFRRTGKLTYDGQIDLSKGFDKKFIDGALPLSKG